MFLRIHVRTIALFGLALLSLTGCIEKSDYEKRCRSAIVRNVHSPETFYASEVKEFNLKTAPIVTVEFHAENAFGADIKSLAICTFEPTLTKEQMQLPKGFTVTDFSLDGRHFNAEELKGLNEALRFIPYD